MSTQHTPGPWKTNGDPYVSTADGRRSIAFCDSHQQAHEDRANARLIAAAPDLLDALLRVLRDVASDGLDGWEDQARAAIAKATGEQA
jgi:hypothetical protein